MKGVHKMPNIKDLLKLLRGFKSFKEKINQKDETYMQALSQNQQPKILVIACSDSRVDPAILTNADLGDLFIVRNVANIVPPYQEDHSTYHGTSAAIEFAVNFLGVKHIIVLGHSNCGGIKALIETDPRDHGYKFILDWVNIMKDAKEIAQKHPAEQRCTVCEQESIKISLENLATFPFIHNKLLDDKIQIHGFYFRIETGSILYYNKEENQFVDLEKIL